VFFYAPFGSRGKGLQLLAPLFDDSQQEVRPLQSRSNCYQHPSFVLISVLPLESMVCLFCLSSPAVDQEPPAVERLRLQVKARLLLVRRLMGRELLDSELLAVQTIAAF